MKSVPKLLSYLFFFLFLFFSLSSLLDAQSKDSDVIVYVTKTGKKYHSENCRYLSKSKIAIKLSEASQSYSPCSVCKPSKINISSTENSSYESSSKRSSSSSTSSSRCQATTKKGTQCKRNAKAGSSYCWQHGG